MTADAREAAAAYDALPYPSVPRPETQPDRLGVVARLLGLDPPPPGRARVLEVGCSDAGNLLATALAHPGAEVVGVDLAPAQVAAGRAAAAALGATNVRLEVLDLRDLPRAGLGAFDAVIAHGLFAWVEPDVQDALLAALPGLLAPHGVAYVGTSVLPGAQGLLAVREWLVARVPAGGDPRARVTAARALADRLAELAPPATAALHAARRELLQARSDAWVRHELLAATNRPPWVGDLLARARARGLRYLADADLAGTNPANLLAPHALAALERAAPDALAREQLLDDLVGRSFRRALFVRADAPPTGPPDPARLAGLWAVGRCRSAAVGDGDETFAGLEPPEGRDAPPSLTVASPLVRAALRRLADAAPEAVAIDDLPARLADEAGWGPPTDRDAALLREHLLAAHLRGLVELWRAPPAFVVAPSTRPVAWPLARRRAAAGEDVTSLRHEVEALDPLEREVLVLLDGTRDRPALAAALEARAAAGHLVLADDDRPLVTREDRALLLEGLVDEALERLGRAALLVA